MAKIILLDPKGPWGGFNSGLAYLAGSLIKAGNDVKVLDFNNNQDNIFERLKEVSDVDWVGISVKTATMDEAKLLSQLVKKINPNIKIVVGGVHITLDVDNFIKGATFIDYFILGQGEKLFIDLIEHPQKYNRVVNLNWEINEMKELPHPDYTVFDTFNLMKNYPLITSYGCPYKCTYCSVPVISKRKWKAREVDDIIKELKTINKKHFHILDDNFTLDMNRAKLFCREYIKSGLKMTWDCTNGIRADRLDEELIGLMKQAGCVRIALGVESMDDEVFKFINKGEEISKIVNAIKLIQKHKIKLSGFLIFGLPKSTFKKDMETVNKVKKLKINCVANLLVPYPYTEARNIIMNNKNYTLLEDFYKTLPITFEPIVAFETKEYSKKERIKAFYRGNLRLGNYQFFVKRPLFRIDNIYNLIKLIIKYDTYRLFYYLYDIIKKQWNK